MQSTRTHDFIVLLGSNDLDSSYSVELIVTKLASFAAQLKQLHHLENATILSYFPRERTRFLSPELYSFRVKQAYACLKLYCLEHGITFRKLRGFSNKRDPILSDGVYFNGRGNYKLLRQHRGLFLHRISNITKYWEDRGFSYCGF